MTASEVVRGVAIVLCVFLFLVGWRRMNRHRQVRKLENIYRTHL